MQKYFEISLSYVRQKLSAEEAVFIIIIIINCQFGLPSDDQSLLIITLVWRGIKLIR